MQVVNGRPRAENPLQELSPGDRRWYGNLFEQILVELQHIRALLEVRNPQPQDEDTRAILRRMAGAKLPYIQRGNGPAIVDVEGILGSPSLRGFILAGSQPLEIRWRARSTERWTQPFRLQPGQQHDFTGLQVAQLEIREGGDWQVEFL